MRLEWDEGLSVGVEEIDVQHRQVIRRLRRMMEFAAEGKTAELRTSLRFLDRYVAEHFAHEERWMAEHGYPGALDHQRAHAALLDAMQSARRAVDEGGEDGLAPAARIASTVEEHMRTEDLRLGQFWAARENLRRLAERKPGTGVTLTPIPGPVKTVGSDPRDDCDADET